LLKDRTEDELTIELTKLLRMTGFEAAHESKVGGHCDIVIRHPSDYLWLAEAKKHKNDYGWLLQGFQQLNTRYATGAPNQNCGGFIIFHYGERVDRTMTKWRAHLTGKIVGIATADCALDPMCFFSEHAHQRTGLPLKVRHMPLSLFFQPQDHARGTAAKRTTA
jgi:hypothetical protein